MGSWRAEGGPVSVADLLGQHQGVVNLNFDSYRFAFPAFAAGLGVRVGTAPAAMAWLYTHSSPFLGKDPLIHERDSCLLQLEYATASPRRFFRRVRVTQEALPEMIESSQLVQKWRKIGLPPVKRADLERARALTGCEPGRYVLINPTSSRTTNTWPASSFHELLTQEAPRLRAAGVEPLVIGSPAESEWLKRCAPEPTRILQPQTLQELADVLAGAMGLLTNTSSMQFMAAAMQTRTVTLMGRAKPEIWGPVGPRDRFVRGEPPAELEHDIFAQEQAAYESIPYAAVANGLNQLAGLTASSGGSHQVEASSRR
jgi:ADP-heptose:LPS heptosyltransferase